MYVLQQIMIGRRFNFITDLEPCTHTHTHKRPTKITGPIPAQQAIKLRMRDMSVLFTLCDPCGFDT